jgi:parallel beta-helix repeat protein
MKYLFGSCSLLVASFFVSPARAATWFVSPTGTAETGCTTRATPCSLAAAASGAVAGDTVALMDGLYEQPLYVANSGTASSPITFQADECATPIIEGEGAGPDVDDQSGGVHSTTAEYVRFVGIVVRGFNIGFGNGWAGGVDSSDVSNGHWEIEHCVSYSNGRTGFTFFSAGDFRLKHSISAHNGSSRQNSWSSGVTLFEATGTNVIEGNVSFENTDAQNNTDGSGFIVDEASNNALFVNNIAFGNSGSCLRLTDSSGTRFINNTCYRNSQFGSAARGPSNPGEIYFTNAGVTVQGVTFMNNVIVGTGQAPSTMPIVNQPSSGWTNNVVTTGMPSFFTAPTGTNPSFVPASGDMQLTGKGSSASGVPTTDIGLDPKCIVKRTPVMVGEVARVSTWQYDVDIDYIKSIGGVAKCFNGAMRSGTPDIGAYRAGTVTTVTPGSCVPPPIPPTGGMGGMGGLGGASDAGGAAGVAGMVGGGGAAAGMGGAPVAGASGANGTAGASGTAAGGVSAGGAANGGVPGAGTSAGGAPGLGGSGAATAGSGGGPSGAASGDEGSEEPAGCGCRVPRPLESSRMFTMLGLLIFGAFALRRRVR